MIPFGLVFIAMPAYNAGRMTAEAIDSILAQNYPDCEMIIRDDGRIRLVRNPRNMGEGRVHDKAIEEACGTWVAPVDADDSLTCGRLDVPLPFHPSRGPVLPPGIYCSGTGQTGVSVFDPAYLVADP